MDDETRTLDLNPDETQPGDTPADEPGTTHTVAAAPTSRLRSIRDRIDEGRRKRFTTLPVPFVDGVVVRYRPIADEKREDIIRKREKQKGGRLLASSADVLAETCIGIYLRPTEDDEFDDSVVLVSIDPDEPLSYYVEREDDDDKVGMKVVGEPVTFRDPEFADMLGVPRGNTHRVILPGGLYVTEADVIAAADKVLEVTGYATVEALEDARGN